MPLLNRSSGFICRWLPLRHRCASAKRKAVAAHKVTRHGESELASDESFRGTPLERYDTALWDEDLDGGIAEAPDSGEVRRVDEAADGMPAWFNREKFSIVHEVRLAAVNAGVRSVGELNQSPHQVRPDEDSCLARDPGPRRGGHASSVTLALWTIPGCRQGASALDCRGARWSIHVLRGTHILTRTPADVDYRARGPDKGGNPGTVTPGAGSVMIRP